MQFKMPIFGEFMLKVLLTISAAMLVLGCSRFRSKTGDEVIEPANKSKNSGEESSSVEDEQELKVAKLWSRVDELEEEVFRQKERMRLLEKGLLTGIAPDGLSASNTPKNKKESDAPQMLVEEGPSAELSAQKPENPNEMNLDEQEQYTKQLEAARGLYTSARFGKAIAAYEKILTTFAGKVDGGFIKYWIGCSWRQLKEYTTAEEILNEVIEKHPASPWIPRAHYELAKVYIDANNLSSAREKLKFIKNKYQYEDVSELATKELEELPNKL
jgi:TolA-binding protein